MNTGKKHKLHLSTPLLLGPYVVVFLFFIALPVFLAILLSFTYFNTVTFPSFTGLANYISILTQDQVFIKNVLPNTIKFALIVGPFGYALQFLLAWALAQITKGPRTVLALLFYSPSMTTGVATAVIWKIIFSGDQYGYLNYILTKFGLIEKPIQWLQQTDFILPIMIFVTLWGSMGVGFLAMLSGIMNIDPEIYEAGYIDGIKNRFQEIIHITIPSMRPQMLFGAVMAIVNTFSTGQIGVDLTGTNPTPQYAGSTLVTHIEDYGFLRYDMGYAAALSVVLLLIILIISRVANKLFGERD